MSKPSQKPGSKSSASGRESSAKSPKKPRKKRERDSQLAPDVRDQRRLISAFLDTKDQEGRKVGSAVCGIYAFFDFDGAAIYVGQTKERLRVRILRHLTNRRTDAVAMKVLDPMEVATIRVWPFWGLQSKPAEIDPDDWKVLRTVTLDAAEWTVYSQLSKAQGDIINILNEKLPPEKEAIELPESHEGSIVEPLSEDRLRHPDERIARRASTIASLAQIIAERDASLGLRKTLVTQANRLLRLAADRFETLRRETPAEQAVAELIGKEPEDIAGDENNA